MIRDTFNFAMDAVVQALGDEVTYNGAKVRAVFGSDFAAVQSGDVRLSSRRPEIAVRLDDLPAEPVPGDVVVVRGVSYTVATVRPDVEDVSATLVLKRA